MAKILIIQFFCIIILSELAIGQTCPIYDKRNNGNNLNICSPNDPSNYGIYNVKTGDFIFSTTASDFSISKVYYNNTLIQDGNQVLNGSTTFFGSIKVNSNNSNMCFYGTTGAGGLAPAGYYKFEMSANNSTITCNYAVSSVNGSSQLITTPGTIESTQSICSGQSPATLTSQTDATNYSSYKWQKSTTSASSGFSDISPAVTTASYNPGALTETTYFQRLAIDANGIELASNVITVSVSSAGTISPSPGFTWTGNSTTFSTDGTSGGTWSVSFTPTVPNVGTATIDANTGVLNVTGAGSGVVTYTVGSACSSTRNFNVYGTSGSLPVAWESLTAEKHNSQSLIKWSTASEQNTKDFEIQFSANTIDWSPIGTVLAAGNSATQRNYSFIHTSPLKNNNYNYYRILQRDLDGKFSYSKIVSILFNEPGPEVVVYPNPVDDILTIYTSTEQLVSLYNAAGSLVWKAKLPAGRNQLPVNKFSKGVYILATDQLKTRVIIQ